MLIVDDNTRSAGCLSTLLEGWGASTHCVVDGETCLERINQQTNYHLIIIKDAGGKTYLLDLVNQFKMDTSTTHIPIIITHPKHKKEIRESCQHVSGIAFRGNPYSQIEFVIRDSRCACLKVEKERKRIESLFL